MAVVVMVMIIVVMVMVVIIIVMVMVIKMVVIILAAGKGFFFEAKAENRPQGSRIATGDNHRSMFICHPGRRPLTASRSSAEIRSDLETISRLAAAT